MELESFHPTIVLAVIPPIPVIQPDNRPKLLQDDIIWLSLQVRIIMISSTILFPIKMIYLFVYLSLSIDTSVFTLGRNREGQLGYSSNRLGTFLPSFEPYDITRNIPLREDEPVVDGAVGELHTLLLTSNINEMK